MKLFSLELHLVLAVVVPLFCQYIIQQYIRIPWFRYEVLVSAYGVFQGIYAVECESELLLKLDIVSRHVLSRPPSISHAAVYHEKYADAIRLRPLCFEIFFLCGYHGNRVCPSRELSAVIESLLPSLHPLPGVLLVSEFLGCRYPRLSCL